MSDFDKEQMEKLEKIKNEEKKKEKIKIFAMLGALVLVVGLGIGLFLGLSGGNNNSNQQSNAIKISQGTNLSNQTQSENHAIGDEVTLTAGDKVGYRFMYWESNGQKVSDNKTLTFTIDETTPLNYTAVYEKEYTITVATAMQNGSVAPNKQVAIGGEIVQLTVTPGSGYQASSLYYIKSGTTTQTAISLSTKKFNMPEGNITIYAEFEEYVPNADSLTTLSFEYNNNEKTASVSARSNNAPTGELVIPSKVKYNNETYTVTSIKNYTFQDCLSLTGVTIPGSIKTIGGGAFLGCSGLVNVNINNGVEEIGIEAFCRCGIRSISIPQSVNNYLWNAFIYCDSLESIVVDSNNMTYDSRNNCNAIVETQSNTLITGCKNTNIPDGVKIINDAAFLGCTGLETITIPSSVYSIGSVAFKDCSGLTEVILSEGLQYINGGAFENCVSLTSINMPSTVTWIGGIIFSGCTNLQLSEYGNARYLGNSNNAYYALVEPINKNITSCTIKKECKLLCDWAFVGCASLESVIFENDSQLKVMPGALFSDGVRAASLASITIPESIETIRDAAFNNCKSLTTVTIESSNIYNVATSVNNAGYLLKYATTINVLASIDDGTNAFLSNTENYTKSATTITIGEKQYYVYTKNN